MSLFSVDRLILISLDKLDFSVDKLDELNLSLFSVDRFDCKSTYVALYCVIKIVKAA